MPLTRTLLLSALSAALAFTAPAIAQQDTQDDQGQSQQEKQPQQERQSQQDQQNEQRQQDQQRQNQDQSRQQDTSQNRQHDQQPAHRGDHDSPQAGLGVFISETRSGGVEVERVVPNSPAHQAGLREGDRILSVNNERVNSPQQLTQLISQQEPGSQVRIALIRDGQQEHIQAQLASREQAMPERMTRRMEDEGQRRYSSDDNRGQGGQNWNRGQWSDRGQSSNRGHWSDGQQYDRGYAPGGNVEQRIARLESSLNRLTQQMDRLQTQLEQRGATNEYRTRSQQYDSRQRDQYNQAPNQERQDSDFNRDF